MAESEEDRLRTLLGWYVEVVQRLCKGRGTYHCAAGVDPSLVKPGCLYVLDWLKGRPDRLDGVEVEYVEAIDDGGAVRAGGGTVLLSTFTRLVVAGPFSLEE